MSSSSNDTAGYDVLLVEDDAPLARALAMTLTDAGHRVRTASAAAPARMMLHEREPDVILLDLGLPDGDGLDLCAELRAGSNIPIVIVTARVGSADLIAGLEAGADDYVRKPVVGSELSARVSALMRRTERVQGPRTVRVAGLEIETRHGSLRRDGEEIPLTRTERRLLRELAAAAGDVVTREELLERVWGYEDIGDTRLLDVHIRRLRLKLEADPSSPELVRTVRGLGYRLEL